MDRPAPQGAFPAGAPLVVSERCVNTTFAGVNCRRCAEACPVDAVRSAEGAASIDRSACLGCGACLPACPVEAITPRASTPFLRLALTDLPRDEGVVISCTRRRTPVAGVNVVRHDRCLADLGAEQLFELVGGTGREVWLDDSDCATCELASLGPVVERAVGDANSLLQGMGQLPTLRLATTDPLTATATAAAVVEARSGRMSRRGLFRRLIGEVTERASQESVANGLPRRRQRFLATLDRLSSKSTGSPSGPVVAGFGAVVVDADRCSGCGLCATFCPTGALVFSSTTDADGRDRFELRAQAARCVDCGVCTAACPEAAVTVDARADLAALVDRSSKVAASGDLVACEACGVAVARSSGSSQRCFSCRNGVVSPLRDEVGLMADLLARVPQAP